MEIRSVVQREDRYYLISTLKSNDGDFPYQTSIFYSSADGERNYSMYRCYYNSWSEAEKSHANLAQLWSP